MEDTPTFKIYFNKKKQWINIYLWDVHPNTFSNWKGGRWGYFIAEWKDNRYGHFGSVHFVKSRIRPSLVTHELDHVRTEWMLSAGFTIIRQNEERMTEFLDKLVDGFYREYNKINS